MSDTPSPASDRSHGLGLAGAIIAVSAWGLSGVIAKYIDMGGLAIAAYRFTVYGIVVGTLMHWRGVKVSRRMMRESLWGGVALGLDTALFFSAVKLTAIANATLIGSLQPIVVATVAWRLFGETVPRRDMALGLVAIAGAAAVVLGSPETSDASWQGDVLAVGALFAWSAYFVFSKRSQEVITSTEYTVGASIWTGLINLPLAVLFGQSLAWPSGRTWFWLLVLTFGAGVLGHSVMNWAIKQIPLWLGSTTTLLIPVVSTTAAWIFLDEPLAPIQIVAMGVVLAALGIVVSGQSGIGNRPRPLRR
ncbi:MAG: DMT family transporter [Acidimicrobiales bacterium]